MKAIVYDCRDKCAGVTLRLFDDGGRMVLQGQILGDNPQGLCERIAGGLGCQVVWVGSPELTAAPEIAAAAADNVPAQGGWLF